MVTRLLHLGSLDPSVAAGPGWLRNPFSPPPALKMVCPVSPVVSSFYQRAHYWMGGWGLSNDLGG